MTDPRLAEQLAWLMQVEIAAGTEGLTEAIADLSRSDVEQLLGLAVVEIMERESKARKDLERIARRIQDRRD